MMYVLCFFAGSIIGALMMCLCVVAKNSEGNDER